MASGGDTEDGLGGAECVGETGEEGCGGFLRDLPVEWLHRDGDVHMAK